VYLKFGHVLDNTAFLLVQYVTVLFNCWSGYTGTVFGLNNHLHLTELTIVRDAVCCLRYDRIGLHILLLLVSQSFCLVWNSLEAFVLDIANVKFIAVLHRLLLSFLFVCWFVGFSWFM
jgi:hypothetical protein